MKKFYNLEVWSKYSKWCLSFCGCLYSGVSSLFAIDWSMIFLIAFPVHQFIFESLQAKSVGMPIATQGGSWVCFCLKK